MPKNTNIKRRKRGPNRTIGKCSECRRNVQSVDLHEGRGKTLRHVNCERSGERMDNHNRVDRPQITGDNHRFSKPACSTYDCTCGRTVKPCIGCGRNVHHAGTLISAHGDLTCPPDTQMASIPR